MIDRAPSMNVCGCFSQLEVHKLLQHGDQVVCSKVLNGELESMPFTFPEPALSELHHETSLLWVILSHMKPSNEAPIASIPLTSSLPSSSTQPTVKYLCKAATSMTAEIQKLLSWAMLGMLVLAPGHPTPRRLPSVTLGY